MKANQFSSLSKHSGGTCKYVWPDDRRSTPHARSAGTWWEWLIGYLQNSAMGFHFATVLYNPWQAMSSLPLVTPSGGKNNSKKALNSPLALAKAHVGELPIWAKSCLLLLKRNWLIQRLVTAPHNVFILCQNQKITSVFQIVAHSQTLHYSCPLKLLYARTSFLLKSNYISHSCSDVISGESKDTKNH